MKRLLHTFLACLLLAISVPALEPQPLPAAAFPGSGPADIEPLWRECALLLAAGSPAELPLRVARFQELLRQICRNAEAALDAPPRPERAPLVH